MNSTYLVLLKPGAKNDLLEMPKSLLLACLGKTKRANWAVGAAGTYVRNCFPGTDNSKVNDLDCPWVKAPTIKKTRQTIRSVSKVQEELVP